MNDKNTFKKLIRGNESERDEFIKANDQSLVKDLVSHTQKKLSKTQHEISLLSLDNITFTKPFKFINEEYFTLFELVDAMLHHVTEAYELVNSKAINKLMGNRPSLDSLISEIHLLKKDGYPKSYLYTDFIYSIAPKTPFIVSNNQFDTLEELAMYIINFDNVSDEYYDFITDGTLSRIVRSKYYYDKDVDLEYIDHDDVIKNVEKIGKIDNIAATYLFVLTYSNQNYENLLNIPSFSEYKLLTKSINDIDELYDFYLTLNDVEQEELAKSLVHDKYFKAWLLYNGYDISKVEGIL